MFFSKSQTKWLMQTSRKSKEYDLQMKTWLNHNSQHIMKFLTFKPLYLTFQSFKPCIGCFYKYQSRESLEILPIALTKSELLKIMDMPIFRTPCMTDSCLSQIIFSQFCKSLLFDLFVNDRQQNTSHLKKRILIACKVFLFVNLFHIP